MGLGNRCRDMRFCNAAGVGLIRSFESCKLKAYKDGNGILTIGWGHTGPEVVAGLVWTQAQADTQFQVDLIERACTPVSVYAPATLTNNQYAAFCSLCFNIGSGNFHASTALKYANAGALDKVPEGIAMWNKIHGQVAGGLERRRAAEIVLWSTPDTEPAA